MRIKSFNQLAQQTLQPLVLRDTTVVIDGQNFFFDSYQESGLPHEFGCESDRYAAYLIEWLSMFKKANVKCYFMFKGGHANLQKRLQKHKNDTIVPLFMKDIYKEVLKDMEFEYVVCEYESKREMVALALRFDCPIITYDLEMYFTRAEYILKDTLKFNETDHTIQCSYFSLYKFVQTFKVTIEKMAVFLALTDEDVFPDGFFARLYQHLRTPPQPFLRNRHLLTWLSVNTRDQSLTTINRLIASKDKKNFHEQVNQAELRMERRERGGVAVQQLLHFRVVRDSGVDPLWFSKGVAANHIPIDYINLYRSKYSYGPPSKLLTLQVLMYAYDLLTNFQNEGFEFWCDSDAESVTIAVENTYSIRKPDYEANVCVFEKGWRQLRTLGLFEHFLKETLPGIELQRLERLPEDARLLVIALVYFSRKQAADTSVEAASMLLCYVILSVVFIKTNRHKTPKFASRKFAVLEEEPKEVEMPEIINAITVADCDTVVAAMTDYFTVSKTDIESIMDKELLNSLEVFQHCLAQLSDLNTLCGDAYQPLRFSRTFNGSMVYQLLRAGRSASTLSDFLDTLLSPAPTVYAYLKLLLEVYEEMTRV